ncbi:MAG: adenylosuccinate synthase [Muribaculaceae bacterium]|nr:adenylosuccinate synthase [Muribaculaceae bacterium]
MQKLDVVLGLQWGDEGKGKIVDVLTPRYDVVARFQGGPNAGHSLYFGDKSFVLHTVPSGIFREGTMNLIGNGVVIDPVILLEEIKDIEKMGIDVASKLYISKRAHLILPTHLLLDRASEQAKGDKKVGTTGKGIGPAYTDKISRNGLRVGDLLRPDFNARFDALVREHKSRLNGVELSGIPKWIGAVMELVERFGKNFIDSEIVINRWLKENKTILAEGAQGSLLDIDFGSYPFVTSSSTLCAGACTGLGVAPTHIGEVYGIFKAYCTRVGAGPFPTELDDATGEELRQAGHEFGATTGRPRRCGWLDLVALKQTIMLNGVTSLIMMKSDVLDTFDTIRVCVAYKTKDGEETDFFPLYPDQDAITPVYKDFPGWKKDITGCRTFDQLPEELKNYIRFIEDETQVPVGIISVGPDRDNTIIR